MADAVKEAATWEIRHERPEDAPLVEALNAASFGPGRYAKSAYRLREGVHAVTELSFVAIEQGELRGSVRFWPVTVGAEKVLLLGPLAVRPEWKKRGIGGTLMRLSLEAATKSGHKLVILVGDEPYYGPFGFKMVPSGTMVMPAAVDPRRMLACELTPGAASGVSGIVRHANRA